MVLEDSCHGQGVEDMFNDAKIHPSSDGITYEEWVMYLRRPSFRGQFGQVLRKIQRVAVAQPECLPQENSGVPPLVAVNRVVQIRFNMMPLNASIEFPHATGQKTVRFCDLLAICLH